jgi:hypothetical protein
MGKISSAASPTQGGMSVSFFVGTPDNDPQLQLAHVWAAAIVDNVNDPTRAQVGMLVSVSALLNQLREMQDVIAANTPTSPMPALGNLNQATIVLLTRGLDPDPTGTAPQGVLLYGLEGRKDAVAIDETQLNQLTLQDVTDPLARKAVVPTAGASAPPDVVATAELLDFLRRSRYLALYLCTVGGGRRVGSFAQKLAPLIDMLVFHNDALLVLTAQGATLQPPQIAASGPTYQSQTTKVPLTSSDNRSFLPGSELQKQ